MTRRVLEIESLAAFDAHIPRVRRLNGWFVQSVDLSDRSEDLARRDPHGAVFLGCRFGPGVDDQLRARGALIFPALPGLPFDPYRPGLYTAEELYGTEGYERSPDAKIYAWSKATTTRTLVSELAATLHDHAIADALDDATATLDPRLVVGVMGGHALRRGEQAYAEAARLGARLTTAGRTVLTGGGPGAMEAANLGAYLSPWPDALPEALGLLADEPDYAPRIGPWARAAMAVRERWPVAEAGRSLSVPTWFYGHEPTNVFATDIAKYFANALREDTLLHRCRGGVVYLSGQAGTVQEIFQAVTENFYAAADTLVAPLVLVGVDYWTSTYPAWPLLKSLGAGRAMGRAVACVDTVEEAADLLTAGPLNAASASPVAR